MAISRKRNAELERNYRGVALKRLERIKEWKNVNPAEKETIIRGYSTYLAPPELEIVPKLDQARHLINARNLLGYGNFVDANRIFGIDAKKASRLVSMAEKIFKRLPEVIVALAPDDFGGADPERPFGNYQDAVDSTPLPRKINEVTAQKWWRTVSKKQKESRGERHKGKIQTNEKVTYHLFTEFMRKMRLASSEERVEVAKAVIGMVLKESGIDDRIWIDPVRVPSTFKKKRGRPPGKSTHRILKASERDVHTSDPLPELTEPLI